MATAAVTTAEPDRPSPATASVTGPGADGEFPAIADIDRARAAARLMHNRDLFLRMLEWFADQHADAADRTARDLAQGERASAARRMHILRGGAGQLGALEIMTLAGELEEAIDHGAMALEGRLRALGRLIDRLIAASAPWRETPLAQA